jgi:hypothetical protein
VPVRTKSSPSQASIKIVLETKTKILDGLTNSVHCHQLARNEEGADPSVDLIPLPPARVYASCYLETSKPKETVLIEARWKQRCHHEKDRMVST